MAARPRAARAAAVPLKTCGEDQPFGSIKSPSAPAAIQPGVAEMVPGPVRHTSTPHCFPRRDLLVDPVGGHRPPVVHPQPQPGPVRLRVPGPDPEMPVDPAGGLITEYGDRG